MNNLNKNNKTSKIFKFQNIAKITEVAVLAFFVLITGMAPVNASARGTTTIVYLAVGENMPSEKPNTLSVVNGEMVIILGDGSAVSFDFNGNEIKK